jgi:hypothetical protein
VGRGGRRVGVMPVAWSVVRLVADSWLRPHPGPAGNATRLGLSGFCRWFLGCRMTCSAGACLGSMAIAATPNPAREGDRRYPTLGSTARPAASCWDSSPAIQPCDVRSSITEQGALWPSRGCCTPRLRGIARWPQPTRGPQRGRSRSPQQRRHRRREDDAARTMPATRAPCSVARRTASSTGTRLGTRIAGRTVWDARTRSYVGSRPTESLCSQVCGESSHAENWLGPGGRGLEVQQEPIGGHTEEDLACVLVACVGLVAVLCECVRVAEMALQAAFCSDA